MGRKLPPGEAERRRKERARATWSGANYKTYDPEKDGYGSRREWSGQAESFVFGDVETVKPPVGKDLALLGLTGMPATLKELESARRKSAASLFRKFGSDTAPGYAEAFKEIYDAFDRLKKGKK